MEKSGPMRYIHAHVLKPTAAGECCSLVKVLKLSSVKDGIYELKKNLSASRLISQKFSQCCLLTPTRSPPPSSRPSQNIFGWQVWKYLSSMFYKRGSKLVSLVLWAQSSTEDYIRAEHKLHAISESFISQVFIPQVMFFSLFIFRGQSTREPASSRVSYFILRAYTGTGFSHSQHRNKIGRGFGKMQVNGPEG